MNIQTFKIDPLFDFYTPEEVEKIMEALEKDIADETVSIPQPIPLSVTWNQGRLLD